MTVQNMIIAIYPRIEYIHFHSLNEYSGQKADLTPRKGGRDKERWTEEEHDHRDKKSRTTWGTISYRNRKAPQPWKPQSGTGSSSAGWKCGRWGHKSRDWTYYGEKRAACW